MTLQSMTGFARAEGSDTFADWAWELRSVNNKGLDVRLRFPPGYEAIEAASRSIIAKAFGRGSIQAGLQLRMNANTSLPVLNEAVSDAAIEIARKIQKKTGGPMPDAAAIMAVRGVIEMGGAVQDDEAIATHHKNISEVLERAIIELSSMREKEGAGIAAVLSGQIDQISALTAQITNSTSRSPEAIRQALEKQVRKLLENAAELDQDRLHQEAAILAAKADIQEELDRLTVHITASRELLAGGGPVGRKLDFLAQEFNRECNTICSKSNSADVSATGLDMKIVIDQFREQVQNLE